MPETLRAIAIRAMKQLPICKLMLAAAAASFTRWQRSYENLSSKH